MEKVIVILCEKLVVPQMLFHTMLFTAVAHPKIRNIIGETLEKFLERQIWEMNSNLWKEYVKCAALIQSLIFEIFIKLSNEKFLEFLEKEKDMKGLLKEYMMRN